MWICFCEGGKKESVKSWEKPEESETDEDDLDIGITRNASEKKKKEKDSWRVDGRGKVKDCIKFSGGDQR